MQIHRTKLPKQHLARLPEADRSLFLLLGHISNEINVLQKLMLMLRRGDAPSHLIDIVEAGQVMIVMRILIGKLHEAYRVFDQRVQGDPAIRERYGIRGDWSGRDLLRKLNARFKGGSLLTKIRQKIAFHYVDEDRLFEASFQSLPDNEPWELYLHPTVANSFYYASELVAMKAALDLVEAEPIAGQKPDQTKLKVLFDETIAVAGIIMNLSHILMIEILEKSDPNGLVIEPVDFGTFPKLSDIQLPFFVDAADLKDPAHS
jgi:hypothetical protein